MSCPRRKFKLADSSHNNVDLTQFAELIIATINNTVAGKNPKVFPSYFSTDVLNHRDSVAIGKALSKLPELNGYGKEVTIFRLFDGKNYESEDSAKPIKLTMLPKEVEEHRNQ